MEESPTHSLSESPSPSSRLWRPAAQRHLRNQWANLSAYKHKWFTFSSTARSHATSLVNSYLSQRYMNVRDLGVLSDMPDIKKKASLKLFKQQEYYRTKLLASYKDMVSVVAQMVTTGASMRCYLKGDGNNSVLRYSNSVNTTDNGDGGGIPVYTFWSISSFENLADELIHMFTLELNLKRLIVVEFLSISSEDVRQDIELSWSNELYSGEFDDLSRCNLYSAEACAPLLPRLEGKTPDKLKLQTERQPDEDVLQIYLTTWLADVNVDKYRVDEIFTSVGEEMNVAFI